MSNWKTVKLGDVATFLKGKSLSKDDIIPNGSRECIHYGELFTKYNENIQSVISRTSITGPLVLSRTNDVFMPTSDVTPRGLSTASYINKEGVILGGDVLIIRPDPSRLFGLFFAHYVRANKHKIIRLVSGSTVFHLYGSDLKKLQLDLPPLNEQKRIVEILETWQEYLKELDRKIELKKNIKKGLMQQLLTGNIRLPGFNYGWQDTTLDTYAAKKKNAIVDGPFGSQMKLSEFTRSGVPVIEMHHLKDNYIVNRMLSRYVSDDKFDKDLSRSVVYPGDIIISKTGSLGYLGLLRDVDKAIITSRLAKISLDESNADTGFIFQYLKYMKWTGYWERVGQGGTMKILSISNFKKMPIPKLGKSEQTAITNVLDCLDDEIGLLCRGRDLINGQKKYLVDNLITGKIRTPEDLKIPAKEVQYA